MSQSYNVVLQCNGNPCATQTRTVVCGDEAQTCDLSRKPVESRPCSNITCGTWQTGRWSDVS